MNWLIKSLMSLISHFRRLHMLEKCNKKQGSPRALTKDSFTPIRFKVAKSPLPSHDAELIQFLFFFFSFFFFQVLDADAVFCRKPKVQCVGSLQHSWQVLLRVAHACTCTHTHAHDRSRTHYLTGTCCSFDHIMFIPMRTQRKQMTFQQWKMNPPPSSLLPANDKRIGSVPRCKNVVFGTNTPTGQASVKKINK